eukprot:15445027-Alexandrium_andersonii.AAC.1
MLASARVGAPALATLRGASVGLDGASMGSLGATAPARSAAGTSMFRASPTERASVAGSPPGSSTTCVVAGGRAVASAWEGTPGTPPCRSEEKTVLPEVGAEEGL